MAPDHRHSQPSEAPPTHLAGGNSLIGGLRTLSYYCRRRLHRARPRISGFVRHPHAGATLSAPSTTERPWQLDR
jgi:hypothetical protein